MRVFEEYPTPAAKRQAQRGARRGRPTGRATGYLFVWPENRSAAGHYECDAALFERADPVGDAPDEPRAGSAVSIDYLRTVCRRIGLCHLPEPWQRYVRDLHS